MAYGAGVPSHSRPSPMLVTQVSTSLTGSWRFFCTVGGLLGVLIDDETVETPTHWTQECDQFAPDIWNAFQPRSVFVRELYNMYTAANTIYFQFDAELHGASAEEASEFSAGADAWTTAGTSCGFYASGESIETVAPEEGNVQIFYVLDSDLPATACGEAVRHGEMGTAKDYIRINEFR